MIKLILLIFFNHYGHCDIYVFWHKSVAKKKRDLLFVCLVFCSSFLLKFSLLFDQALVECFSAPGAIGPEALAVAEKNAAMLTARAGARDPSAIPSICRVSAALQYRSGKL